MRRRDDPGWARCSVYLLIVGLACGCPEGSGAEPASWQTAVHEYVAGPRFQRAWWAIQVESVETGELLLATNGQRLVQPASSAKLLVAALALDRFGAEHRFYTTLHAQAMPEGGVLGGDLVVRGGGDFSLGAGGYGVVTEGSFDRLLAAVRSAGIERIRGDLVGDATALADVPWGRGWAWDDLQHGYGAPVSALSYGDSRVRLVGAAGSRVGEPCQLRLDPPSQSLRVVNRTVTGPSDGGRSLMFYRAPGDSELWVFGQLPAQGQPWVGGVSVASAPGHFLEQLRAGLVRSGITIVGQDRVLVWPAAPGSTPEYGRMVELGRVASPTLGDLVRGMMAVSQNQAAQLLLLQVGADGESAGDPSGGGPQPWGGVVGLQRLKEFLGRAGIDPAEVRLEEASGLARSDRVTPAALVRLLRYMRDHPESSAFFECLPVQRIAGLPDRAEVRAKTGTLSDVVALAGYLTGGTGARWAFAAALNGYSTGRPGDGRAAVNELIRLVAAGLPSAASPAAGAGGG